MLFLNSVTKLGKLQINEINEMAVNVLCGVVKTINRAAGNYDLFCGFEEKVVSPRLGHPPLRRIFFFLTC